MRHWLLFGGLALVLGAVNVSIVRKERVLATGTTMLVELAPVDPRSLLQGDYMRLDYAMARNTAGVVNWPRDGALVVRLGTDGVARFVRVHEGTPLAAGEHLLQYRRRGGRIRIGSDAFFFQEGHSARYEDAKYGELRVAPDGGSVLVGLRGEERQSLR